MSEFQPPRETLANKFSAYDFFYNRSYNPLNFVVSDPKESFSSIPFSFNGQKLVTLNNGNFYVWNLEGRLLSTLKPQEQYNSIAYSSDGRFFAASGGRNIHLWNFQGEELLALKHPNEVDRFDFSADSQHLVSSSTNPVIRLWDLRGKQLMQAQQLKKDSYSVFSRLYRNPTFSENGQHFATILADKTARLWDSKGNRLAELKPKSWIESVYFSPNNKSVVTVLKNNTLIVWDLRGKQLATIRTSEPVGRLIVSPNGQYIAASLLKLERNKLTPRRYRSIVWNLKGEVMAKLNQEDISYFTPDSQRMTVRSDDAVYLLDLQGN